MNKKFLLLSFVGIFAFAFTSCKSSNTAQNYTTEPVVDNVTVENVSITSNEDILRECLDSKTDAKLVTGENLAVKNAFKENSRDLEEAINLTVEFAETTTICVENYQTVYNVSWSPRDGYVKKENHTLYGWGSGVIYYKGLLTDGSYLYKVITNEHVVSASSNQVKQGEGEYQIYDANYDENLSAKLIGADENADIAVLAFTSTREYNAVCFEDDEKIKLGYTVIAMGTPIQLEYYNTSTTGSISRIRDSYIQHGASINSGNSGGPLFSSNGNLVGINNAKLSGSTSSGSTIEGIFFAITKKVVISSVLDITGVEDIK